MLHHSQFRQAFLLCEILLVCKQYVSMYINTQGMQHSTYQKPAAIWRGQFYDTSTILYFLPTGAVDDTQFVNIEEETVDGSTIASV